MFSVSNSEDLDKILLVEQFDQDPQCYQPPKGEKYSFGIVHTYTVIPQ